MCIRDSLQAKVSEKRNQEMENTIHTMLIENVTEQDGRHQACLLYTSDAADERSSVDLGGRRIIKKKNTEYRARVGVCRERKSRDKRD